MTATAAVSHQKKNESTQLAEWAQHPVRCPAVPRRWQLQPPARAAAASSGQPPVGSCRAGGQQWLLRRLVWRPRAAGCCPWQHGARLPVCHAAAYRIAVQLDARRPVHRDERGGQQERRYLAKRPSFAEGALAVAAGNTHTARRKHRRSEA